MSDTFTETRCPARSTTAWQKSKHILISRWSRVSQRSLRSLGGREARLPQYGAET